MYDVVMTQIDVEPTQRLRLLPRFGPLDPIQSVWVLENVTQS